uniref:Histidine kinase N-terminal 7TM region domain-containing protein n=1 Tax=Dictyoglomus turgidum TaxID=513050 RepID=A0A7C3SMJ0_9BACT
MNFFIISSLINTFVAGLLGFVIIFKNRKELANRLFFGISFAFVFWSINYWQWLSANNSSPFATLYDCLFLPRYLK